MRSRIHVRGNHPLLLDHPPPSSTTPGHCGVPINAFILAEHLPKARSSSSIRLTTALSSTSEVS